MRDRDARYVVAFDGRCRLCRSGTELLRRLDWGRRVRFVDAHDWTAMSHYPELTGADTQRQMWVLDPGGKLEGGYDGLALLAPALPLLRPMSSILHRRPVRNVGRRIYGWVARNRYRIAGMIRCPGNACATR